MKQIIRKTLSFLCVAVACVSLLGGCGGGNDDGGEEPIVPSYTVETICTFDEELDGEYRTTYGQYDCYWHRPRTKPFTYYRIEEENGNKYMFFPTSSGWEGPAFVYPGYQLAQKTNAFTIKVKMNDVDNNFRMNVTYFDDFGERNYSAETQVQSVTVLQDGWVNVTVTVPSYALRVISFEFKTRTDLRYMVDDIRAVAPVEMQ